MEEEYPPVTKDSIIEGILKLYFHNDLSVYTTIQEIKKIDQDTRLKWKKDL